MIDKEYLYSELRETRQELLERLMSIDSNPLIKPYLLAELHDVEGTLKKLDCGQFGTCEISGELLPPDLLANVPTIKSVNDYAGIEQYYRKWIYE